jgi:hypothetical protein
MSACMCVVLGRALWDDRFKEKFFADPVAVCRLYDGPTALASGLRAMTARDFNVLDQQLKSVRTALGEEAMREVADNFGLQMILGRAMLDPDFAKRLDADSSRVVRDFLGSSAAGRKTVGLFQTPQFKKLNGFAKQREAMREVGERFSLGVAHGRTSLNVKKVSVKS